MLELLANTLGAWDIGFFVACAVIVAAIVGFYFLIPIINKKQYQEQRENLKKREAAFKANLQGYSDTTSDDSNEVAESSTAKPNSEE